MNEYGMNRVRNVNELNQYLFNFKCKGLLGLGFLWAWRMAGQPNWRGRDSLCHPHGIPAQGEGHYCDCAAYCVSYLTESRNA